jgi:histidyl-tRNA synthetase
VDIIGVEADFTYPFGMLADAEVIFTTLDYLRQVGLTKNDIEVKISSRKLLAAFLKSIGIAEKDLASMYALLDKKPKMPLDTFRLLLDEKLSDKVKTSRILNFMEFDLLSEVERFIGVNPEVDEAVNELLELGRLLKQMGISDLYNCKFDPSIVRGLAYYTGIVFEVHDIAGDLRAICGGGRYDSLLEDFGGPDIPAVGMGMGDCVLEILLRERKLLEGKVPKQEPDYFVIPVGPGTYDYEDGTVKSTPEDEALKLTAELRGRGYKTDLSYKLTSISKLLQEASSKNARKCIIIGDEFKNKQLVVKDMATGQQELVNVDEFLSKLNCT